MLPSIQLYYKQNVPRNSHAQLRNDSIDNLVTVVLASSRGNIKLPIGFFAELPHQQMARTRNRRTYISDTLSQILKSGTLGLDSFIGVRSMRYFLQRFVEVAVLGRSSVEIMLNDGTVVLQSVGEVGQALVGCYFRLDRQLIPNITCRKGLTPALAITPACLPRCCSISVTEWVPTPLSASGLLAEQD
jgi:hypothetical protein